MTQTPELLSAKVMHSRKVGCDNSFVYNILFLRLPLSVVNLTKRVGFLGLNRFGFLGFNRKDHFSRADVDPTEFLNKAWEQTGFDDRIKSVQLLALPRVLGYAFKPVSFWFALNDANLPIAVLAEVNNTFGETHAYLCHHGDGAVIKGSDTLSAQKQFHVSPFIERNGYYEFKFSYKPESVVVGINHFDDKGVLRLTTSLNCRVLPADEGYLSVVRKGLGSFFVFPLILWQALKLKLKGRAYVPKPEQKHTRMSSTDQMK
ncbi:MAG: DUF1365 domain-containing protein [Alphaproteobacteria bacterium]